MTRHEPMKPTLKSFLFFAVWIDMKLKSIFAGFVLACASMAALACSDVANPDAAIGQLSVSNTSLSYAVEDGRGIVTTLGTVKNASDACFSQIVFEVKYFDAKGALIDVVTRPAYGLVVQSSKEVAFRVRDEADKPKDAYASSSARVIAAEVKNSGKSSPTQKQFWIDLFISWGPMVMLIGIWLLFMRRHTGPKSVQQRSLAALERQVQALERVAVAIEKASGDAATRADVQ